jgi:sugar lactone lactonase YvrE
MMAEPTIHAATEQVDQLGECPIWDDRLGVLLWIDIDGRSISRFDPTSGSTSRRTIPGRPGSMAMTDDPELLLVAAEHQIGFLAWSTGEFSPWIDVEAGGGPRRLNDGACDRLGRFWVGSMHEDGSESIGVLHRVAPGGATSIFKDGIGVSNGLAFSPDGTTMYFADSLANVVWAYDYDQETGTPSRERVFNDFSGLPGSPDGSCVDEDGCYWIACYLGSAVVRLTPRGDLDRIIDLPVSKPTKPAFGGPAHDVMYLTSIGGGGSHPVPNEPGLNGRLLSIEMNVRGIPEPHFPVLPGVPDQ